jgi:hypothetical protein
MFQNILGHHIAAFCPIAAHRFGNEIFIYRKLQTTQDNIAPSFYGANKSRHTIFVKYGEEKLEPKVSAKCTRAHTHRTHESIHSNHMQQSTY